MTDENDRAPMPGHVLHLSDTLLLESSVADSQHLVDNEDFWIQVRCHGKGEPHYHAT